MSTIEIIIIYSVQYKLFDFVTKQILLQSKHALILTFALISINGQHLE